MTLKLAKPSGASLKLAKPTGAKLVCAQTYVGIDDSDATTYITAVEAADGQSLETAVKVAIHSFVKGCKADGIWPAIKASCILAGARTLSGALVPLVGTAPTNFNFVSGDYNRKTGLTGDGSTKYINANRNNNTDPRDNRHLFSYVTQVNTSGSYVVCLGTDQNSGDSMLAYRWDGLSRIRYALSSVLAPENIALSNGGFGASRSNSTQILVRRNGGNATLSSTSAASTSASINVFRGSGLQIVAAHRLAFYSIGEALDLAKLDARVTELINAFAAAIP